MKNFLLTNIFGFTITLAVIVFYNGIFIENISKSFQMYIMLNFSAFFSFLNFFNLKNITSFMVAIGWVALISFALYNYKYSYKKHSLYLWFIFMLLWLLLGVYNPDFKA